LILTEQEARQEVLKESRQKVELPLLALVNHAALLQMVTALALERWK
jgi:hypothetical protein